MKKKLLPALVILVLIACGAAFWLYSRVYSSATGFKSEQKVVLLYNSNDIDALSESLLRDSIITSKSDFLFTAKLKKFKGSNCSGRYAIKKGTSNGQLVNKLRIQAQSPLQIRFGQESNMAELAGNLGRVLMHDSLTFLRGFEDEVANYSPEFSQVTFPCLFMPNTYEVYWNISPKAFVAKMHEVHKKFWTEERKSKAETLGYSPAQIVILASIVKKETGKVDEAPKIAGLYLNRLRIGMKLQSDPTSLFASGETDVQRVRDQIGIESDFNTYHTAGLPPGPIAFTEDVYIDAVLNAESHDYLYMCARPERNGYHNFSRTHEQHLTYARAYWKALDAAGIE
ncbi:MAG: hypothetical protein RL220_959 [Bacteroidota bacterium]|jgi:UPF0755 protein